MQKKTTVEIALTTRALKAHVNKDKDQKLFLKALATSLEETVTSEQVVGVVCFSTMDLVCTSGQVKLRYEQIARNLRNPI